MGSGTALALLLVIGATSGQSSQQYLGRPLGALSELHHAVRGAVFAVDSRTLFIKDFHYDGEGPAAFFYVGTSGRPSASGGLRLRDERGGTGPLRRYRGEGVTLALPDGHSLKDVRWFSVWCDEFSVNFGDVSIPRDLEYPRPARVGALRGVHGVSSDPIVVVDAQTLLVPNFSYDGEAPDAKFWVGRGEKPSPQGIRIPDENGKEAPLRKYDKKTIVLTLPGDLTVFDIGHFAVWCEAFTVNFGHVPLPRAALSNVPPSLKMLGVSPQSKLNCEVLYDELAFEVRWAVAGDSIVLQLVAKLEDGEYMSFGISGDGSHSQMVAGDVAVAWVDKQTLKGYAQDYYLDAKSQCAGVRGSCPDERLGEKTNSIRLLNAALVNGYSIVTYQRSLRAADQLDRPVLTNTSQPIIWALGPLNSRQEVSYHHHFTKGDRFIEFGRPPLWNCPMPEGEDEPRTTAPPATRAPPRAKPEASEQSERTSVQIKPNPVPTPKPVPRVTPWEIPGIQCYEPPDGVFYAQMGPTGGKQGYSAITGHVGWGISWYINGLLIPEITVVRGKKYTFVVEGGSDPEVPARFHPFYITNDPVGGYYHKTNEERKAVEIYAGVRRSRSGELVPSGIGRLCNWTPDNNGPEADEYPSFGAYQRSLTLVCEEGSPGVVTWTPDASTPNTVYYQCFTHRYLGWKINVVDACDEELEEAQESRVAESVAPPDDLAQEESIQVATRIRPDSNFLDERKKVEKIINTKTNYNDFSSDKDRDVLTGETYEPEYESPVVSHGQIRDVIEAVETLESRMRDARRNNTRPGYLGPPHNHGPPQGLHGPLQGPNGQPQGPFGPPQGHHGPLQSLHGPGPHQAHQYQVHENPDAVPERPIREDDEYIVQPGKMPDSYFLPPSTHPLTLQTVLRPIGPNKRPPFRRPAPPEIKLRRPGPQQQHSKPLGTFPLPMPMHHGPHHIQKKTYGKPSYSRLPSQPSNRPMQPQIPPMKAMPPLPHLKPFMPPKQLPKQTQSSTQSIIIGKPGSVKISSPPQSQTLSLGRTDIIANQVVKSQITLPGGGDSMPSSSVQQTFINQPGQIILGKPMDHPVPLDQQMMPTRQHFVSLPPTPPPEPKSTTLRIRLPAAESPSQQNEVKSSDFIGESTDPSTLQPAINTGFKPNTIVIESGFKPIIREPLMDRLGGDYEVNDNVNRREDTDVPEDYEESPQPISNHAYETPSDKITETFEPMFIPSPPDLNLPTNDRTKEIFPKNHAKEDRPHPVYVKTESELNALFSKNNMEKDVPADMIMEADRVSPQYLPPDPKLPKEHSQKLAANEETFTTYDGKTVSAASLTSVPNVKLNDDQSLLAKLPPSTELLLKTPQFGPFKGEIPPAVAGSITTPSVATSDEPAATRTTHLKLVNVFNPEGTEDELNAEGSEQHVVKVEKDEDQDKKDEKERQKQVNENKELENNQTNDEYDENMDEYEEIVGRMRRKRDASDSHLGTVTEQIADKEERQSNNQIEFDTRAQSTATRVNWSNLLLVPLLLKLF